MLWGAWILLGSIAYLLLKGNTEVTPNKQTQYEKGVYDKTLEYWLSLPLGYQLGYAEWSYDLKEIRDELTDNTYLNSHKVARLAERLGKSFTDINKRY